jgi:hypothetical protein
VAKQTSKQPTGHWVTINEGRNQRLWVIPDVRLVMRLRIDGRKLVASFEEGRGHAWERVSNYRSAVRAELR